MSLRLPAAPPEPEPPAGPAAASSAGAGSSAASAGRAGRRPDGPRAAGRRPAGGDGAADGLAVRGVAVLCLLPAVAGLAVALFLAFRIPPLFGADEPAHLAYAGALLDGRLPEITDPQVRASDLPVLRASKAAVDAASGSVDP